MFLSVLNTAAVSCGEVTSNTFGDAGGQQTVLLTGKAHDVQKRRYHNHLVRLILSCMKGTDRLHDREILVQRICSQAAELGFHLCGIAPAVTPQGAHRLVQWVAAGYAAGMNYFADRLEAYADPGRVLAGVRSIVVLAYPYRTVEPILPSAHEGRIARYAWGSVDYHDLIHPRLKQLKETIRVACPQAEARGVVDTAPLMEREFAQLAGLGWAGKNSLLLNKQRGSYFFLACLLTTLDLPLSEPHETAHCGTCTRCLDACPTDAFAAPGVVDSRRCISYLTIEHRGAIPRELRLGMGNWLFGCDVCQEVCPWNQRAAARSAAETTSSSPQFWPREGHNPVDLIELLMLDEEAFRERFRHTPLWRPRRRGILRNAAICLGNARDPRATVPLVQLLDDPEPLIRGAAAWALGQIGGQETALQQRLQVEDNTEIRQELEAAIGFSTDHRSEES